MASSRVGPLGQLGLTLRPVVALGSYLPAVAAGLVCLAVLVLPTVRQTSFAGARAARGRATRPTLVQRSGLDLVLLAVALLGLWQVRRVDGTVARDLAGRIGADPLLLATPALGLLAGAVLTGRLVALGGRVSAPLARRARTLVPALGTWQLGRRLTAVSRPVVLVVLAVAIAVLAGSYGDTWLRSQHDQAVAAIGADVALEPDQRGGSALGSHLVGGGIAALPEVTARTPVVETEVMLARGRGVAQVLALDVTSGVGEPRPLDRPDPATTARLHAPVPLPGVDLADGQVLLGSFGATLVGPAAPRDDTVSVALTIADGDGLVHRLPDVRTVAGAGDAVPFEVPLRLEQGDRRVAVTPPVRLLAVEVAAAPGLAAEVADSPVLDLAITDLRVDEDPVDLTAASWAASEPVLGGSPAVVPVVESPVVRPGELTVRLRPGVADARSGSARVELAPPATSGADTPVPALATPGLLAATELTLGDTLELRLDGTSVSAELIGTTGHLVGRPAAAAGLVVDLSSVASRAHLAGATRTSATSWWVATSDPEATAAALDAAPFLARRTDTAVEREAALRDDPVSAGILGVLTFGAVVAAIAAVVGYVASAGLAARERRGDAALLRAVGTTRRELHRWMSAETVVTAGLASLTGVLLGSGLSRAIVPSIAVARDGTAGAPPPVWVLPVTTLTVVAATTAVVCLVVPWVLARSLASLPIGTELRAGEGR